MSWVLRMTASLVDDIRADLTRPHPFAFERIGYVLCRIGNQGSAQPILLPFEHLRVDDGHYIPDHAVGARISGAAIRSVMERVLNHRVAALHVHMHDHEGVPRYSGVDLAEYPKHVQAMRNVGSDLPHGALLLSRDSAAALVWIPSDSRPAPGGRIVMLGRPALFEPGGALYA